MPKKYPTVSFLIPTFNVEESLEACLKTIFNQDYPKNKIEVFIVDNYSTDKTLEIAKKYPVKILMNKVKDAQVGKRMAFDRAKGEFYSWIDADMELADKKWIKKMVAPMLDDEEIVASVCTFKLKGNETNLTKFLTINSLSPPGYSSQLDPIFRFFVPRVVDTIVEKRKGYSLCLYKPENIPTMGVGLYRKSKVQKTVKHQGNKLMELDVFAHLVELGYEKFAYVSVGVYHNFMSNLWVLVKKRWRHISRNYLGQDFERSFKWFDLKNPKDVMKIILLIIYVHLFIPELLYGIYKSIKHKTWVGLYQPIVSLIETDAIILGFVYYYLKLDLFGKDKNTS